MKFFELLIEINAKLINSILSLMPILLNLSFMNLFPQMILPLSNICFQFSNFTHKRLELNVGLNLQTVVGY